MTNLVRNRSEYPKDEVTRLVRWTLRELGADDVCVTVAMNRRRALHTWGDYREFWYPSKGEDRPQIRAFLTDDFPHAYTPYERRDAPPIFELRSWREALVAIVAHEAMHHRQTPRKAYGTVAASRGGSVRMARRYVEVECDWAAYRTVRRYRGTL